MELLDTYSTVVEQKKQTKRRLSLQTLKKQLSFSFLDSRKSKKNEKTVTSSVNNLTSSTGSNYNNNMKRHFSMDNIASTDVTSRPNFNKRNSLVIHVSQSDLHLQTLLEQREAEVETRNNNLRMRDELERRINSGSASHNISRVTSAHSIASHSSFDALPLWPRPDSCEAKRRFFIGESDDTSENSFNADVTDVNNDVNERVNSAPETMKIPYATDALGNFLWRPVSSDSHSMTSSSHNDVMNASRDNCSTLSSSVTSESKFILSPIMDQCEADDEVCAMTSCTSLF